MTSETRALPDAEARRGIREDLDATLFVEAAAGTGKTTALVGRIVSLLRTGAGTLEGVVAVTFTEKAAGEMRLRLRGEIEKARSLAAGGSVERARLERALEELELARIGTIHAFCADLLHERPVEAGVDPGFEVSAEDESERLLDGAFDSWFQRTLADPPEGVRRVLRRRPRGPNARGPRDALRTAAATLVNHRDFDASWQRPTWDRTAAIDAAMEALESLAEIAEQAENHDDYLARNLANVARFVGDTRLRESVGGRDHDGLEAGLRELAGRRTGWHWRGFNRRWFAEGVARDEVLLRRDAVKASLDATLEAADADLAACLREELRPVVHAYQAAKQRAGVLDFVDLLIRARDLIVADAAVRTGYQARFTHFFVDEFQDTDPLQAEILLLLAADDPEERDWHDATPVPGKIFLVGDPKQSIYRFRRADVAIYEATKRHLEAHGAAVLYLTTSFRSVPSLQDAVNAAFAPHMRGAADGSQADYVALQPAREEVTERPTIVALPVPRPYGDYGRVVSWRIEDSLPDATGAFVEWLVKKSGWTLVDRDGRSESIRPRHVCLLFRRFKSFREDVTRPYVRALEARGVSHVLVGGRSFHDREEVLAIRNALGAIEWPDDDLRVYATLRGPLFALSDEALLAFRHLRGSLHPLRPPAGEPSSDAEREVEEALAVLRSLHVERNRRSIADTISRLLEAVRAHAGIAIWPTGEQALANCLRTVDLARRFERGGAPSFRAFVERMEAGALRGDAEDAPVVEEGTEGVRIMTTHRAKGLEFPVVVLCDPTCRVSRDQPTRHVDPLRGLWAEPLCGCAPHDLLEHREEELRRDHAEGVRIAYVAATRARDLLVVPVVADDEQEGGWLEALHPVVYPETGTRGEAAPGPGCPPFGQDAIVARPHNARKTRAPVAPGRLSPRAGPHDVVWWDPSALRLDVAEDVGLRQQRILEADRDGSVAASGERAHERWQTARNEMLERGAIPSIEAVSVTALASDLAEQEGSAPVVAVQAVEEARGERPAGRRFGILVHAVLATVSLDAHAEEVHSVAALQGRLVGASAAEVGAAACAVEAALHHPLMRRAARAAALRRETPVILKRPNGVLAEGVVDLAFREESPGGPRWTVVDFKTDREIADRRAAYEAQVGLYVDAVARATGEPAEGMLLVL